jgi:hypothetical protein
MKHKAIRLTAIAAAIVALSMSAAGHASAYEAVIETRVNVAPAILDLSYPTNPTPNLTLKAVVEQHIEGGWHSGNVDQGKVRFYVGNALVCTATATNVGNGYYACGGPVAALRTVAGPLSYRAVYSGGVFDDGGLRLEWLPSRGEGPSIRVGATDVL